MAIMMLYCQNFCRYSQGMVVSDAVGCTGVEGAREGVKKVGVGKGHP